MIDGIIKADGTSRLMRANLPETYEEFKAQAAAGNLPLDVLFNADGWNQMPTFLNKANLLEDDTASMFNFGELATPNGIFAFLGKYNLHWWKMRGYGSHYETFVKSNDETYTISVPSSGGRDFYYSDSITISQTDGKISLVAPKMVNVKWGQQSNCSNFIGKYVAASEYQNLNEVLKFDTDVTFTSVGQDSNTVITFKNGTQTIIGIYVEEGSEWQLVFSKDSDAYPKSGVVNGFEYQYLGIPFEKFPTMPQVAIGNYVGTGLYGQNNPNSLTFDFIPYLIGISVDYQSGNETASAIFTCPKIGGKFNSGGGARGIAVVSTNVVKIYPYASADGKTVYWVSPDTEYYQFNRSGVTYNYFAIG